MSSENERLKILSMLADGIISAEDAMKRLAEFTQVELSAESQAQDPNHDPQESVFCIPGGKCYTLDELKNLVTHLANVGSEGRTWACSEES